MIDKHKIKIIEMDITTLCNAKCPLCFRNTQNFKDRYSEPYVRPYEDIIKQLNEFENLEYVYLIGQFSEPTTHNRLFDIIDYLKSRNIKIKICTNGDLHDDSYWMELGKHLTEDDRVWFAICGLNQKEHEFYRKNTLLERILSHAKSLRKTKHIDCLKFIRFNYNYDICEKEEFKDISKQFLEYEITDTCLPKIDDTYVESYDFKKLSPCEKVYGEYKKMNTLSDFYFRNNTTNLICQSIEEQYIQIDPYGKIFPCYMFIEKYNEWDGDYENILSKKCDCCKLCVDKLVEYCDKNKLNHII